VILNLGAFSDSVLEVCISFRLQMAKVEVLEISGSWSRFVGLNMTCVQNLGSIGRGLLGFGIGCGNLKFQVL